MRWKLSYFNYFSAFITLLNSINLLVKKGRIKKYIEVKSFQFYDDSQLKDECRIVKHIVFSSWPDQKTPESVKTFLNLVLEAEKILQASESTGPVVVHCR